MNDPLSTEAFVKSYDFQQNPDKGDRSLRVTFYLEEIPDEKASETEGRPIFRSVEMCEIHGGDKDNVVIDQVKYMRPDPRKRFPEQYARFKSGEATQVIGTLLREWGLLDRATAKSYEAAGIMTVEQLSGLSDGTAQKMRGALTDRQKARDFLAMAQGQAPIVQARAEMARMQQEIQSLREQVRAGGAEQETATHSEGEPPKRRPGRPRKNPEA